MFLPYYVVVVDVLVVVVDVDVVKDVLDDVLVVDVLVDVVVEELVEVVNANPTQIVPLYLIRRLFAVSYHISPCTGLEGFDVPVGKYPMIEENRVIFCS